MGERDKNQRFGGCGRTEELRKQVPSGDGGFVFSAATPSTTDWAASTAEMCCLTAVGPGSPRSRCPQGGFLVKRLFVASRCVLTWCFLCVCRERELSVLLPLIRTAVLEDQDLTLMTSFNLNYQLKGSIYLQIQIHWGLGFQHINLGVTVQFLTDGFAEANKPREEINPVG